MTIYIKFDAELNLVPEQYDDWIIIDSLNFGAAKGFLNPKETQNGLDATPTFSEISISKTIDETSPKIFSEVWNNKVSQLTKVHLVRVRNNKRECYFQIELKNSLIVSYSFNLTEDEKNWKEGFTLGFEKISMKFIKADGSSITEGFDLISKETISKVR